MARALGHWAQVHGLVFVQMEGTPRALLPDLPQSKVTESLGIRMWREASSEGVSGRDGWEAGKGYGGGGGGRRMGSSVWFPCLAKPRA